MVGNFNVFISLIILLSFKVSLYMRLQCEFGIAPQITPNVWHDEVVKTIAHLTMDPGMAAQVKKGLEFGQQVNLPSDLAFSSPLLANLFASEGRVRPFLHLR